MLFLISSGVSHGISVRVTFTSLSSCPLLRASIFPVAHDGTLMGLIALSSRNRQQFFDWLQFPRCGLSCREFLCCPSVRISHPSHSRGYKSLFIGGQRRVGRLWLSIIELMVSGDGIWLTSTGLLINVSELVRESFSSFISTMNDRTTMFKDWNWLRKIVKLPPNSHCSDLSYPPPMVMVLYKL